MSPPQSRPLVLAHLPSFSRVSFPIDSSDSSLIDAEISREEFSLWLDRQFNSPLRALADQPDSQSEDEIGENDSESEAENVKARRLLEANLLLLAHYLEFSSTRSSDQALTKAALNHFHQSVLRNSSLDVYFASAELTSSEEARKYVIKAYFLARGAFDDQSSVPELVLGKLWGANSCSKLFGVFGGQGVNETYWDELENLYELYPTLLSSYLSVADQHMLILAQSEAAKESSLYKDQGIHVLRWLKRPLTKPSVAYLASCAISLPLIGLVQIAHYVALGRTQGLSPNKLSSQLSGGVTGHSQGVVVAALVAGRLSNDTWEQFYGAATHALTVLFHIGLRGSVAFPKITLPPRITAITAQQEGIPTPMLAVTGIPIEQLQKCIDETSSHFNQSPGDGKPPNSVMVSLFNGPKAFIVTGHPRSLVGLVSALRDSKAEAGKDQSKIPFSKRLPVFSMRFLPIGVPYHSNHLQGCTSLMMRALDQGGIGEAEKDWWETHKKSLGCAVFHTETGADLRSEKKGLLESFADQIFTSPIQWSRACNFAEDVSHVVDFGLGNLSGIGSLVARNIEGRGIRVVYAGLPVSGQGNKIMNEVYNSMKVIKEEKWDEKYKITLVKTRDGRLHINTPFSRLLSKPPLMVAGMTPCTVPADFNAAVMNAGYHIELAGGGHYNEKALRGKVNAIRSQLQKPGLGFTLNALYINQKQWAFQFPLWMRMRQEGLPIEGFVVAAGIPSPEKAKEIIEGLREAGIKHVSFKPGSVDGIRQVVNIAALNPDFPVICQWTGGRAGGHHSCEDFHQPILSTYASIRAQSNLILIAGSGFGSHEDVYPYLTGQWSKDRFGVEKMPFDGVLFASRMMVAKEAATSQSVKELIVQAPGVPDEKWEGTYARETGGIITVTSELGEPIHKIANRGIKLWKEFDETVFALPREKRAAWLESHRDYVIRRLNSDFQKPWFASKDGQPAELGDMTYEETVHRLVRLLYVSHQSRWIDPSLRNLVGDWLRRIEERLSVVNGAPKVSELQSYSELDKPAPFLTRFFNRYDEAKTQILASEDIAYFLAICQRPGQKPVPFIPVLDENFGIWFKKDSLWQAEDIDAVFDQDPQRVAILQGPVAVAHSKSTDQTAGEILGNIESGLIKRLLDEVYGGDESKVPYVDYLMPIEGRKSVLDKKMLGEAKIRYNIKDDSTPGRKLHTYDIDGVLPHAGSWLETLASGQSGPKVNWLTALLTSLSIVQGKDYIDNPMRKVMEPRKSQRVQVVTDLAGNPLKVKVFGAIRNTIVTS
ncbi:hypothetical protein BY996DRAFT_7786525 [Phakopsora pachyrhizi]|uniref:Fatty acid synthase subunit beta n=1 Tax=Phakopsora pachyrhizi TaxID=170000 RepID=A0AAV0AXH7_PHAPC|nr:hypothetical protein BY996DRAFT_7786525 [Phakopsora pachyrhizi]CAH7674047.1 hypothetical protein PPACK8108_LOCUS8949 [Phakopsora pachyrhizi]